MKTVAAESSADQDTTQIANKIKDLIHLKGAAPKPATIKEVLPASHPSEPTTIVGTAGNHGFCVKITPAMARVICSTEKQFVLHGLR